MPASPASDSTVSKDAHELPDAQALIDELLARRGHAQTPPAGPAETIARVQAVAALCTLQPDAIDAGLRAVDPAFADPARWAVWASWAGNVAALDVLHERWGMSPVDRVDGHPVFAWTLARNARVWQWCREHGVSWTHRWDDDEANHPGLAQAPVGVLPLLMLDNGHEEALRGLDEPSVQQDQDLLDHTLFTLTVRLGEHARDGHPVRALDVLRRLLDLGANPLRMIDGRGTPPQVPVGYLTGSATIDRETLGRDLTARDTDPKMARLGPPQAQRASLGACVAHHAVSTLQSLTTWCAQLPDPAGKVSPEAFWAVLAPAVDWSRVPADSFGRTPLAWALSATTLGQPLPRSDDDQDPERDLGWNGRALVQDLMARGAPLAGATPGWEPLRLAWAKGAGQDLWGPFWEMCRFHRDRPSPERLGLPTMVGMLQDWAALWGEHLGKGWPKLDSSARQARVMEQTARARALVQWASDDAREPLKDFLRRAQDDLRGLMAPAYQTPEEVARFDAQVRLLPETWTLRAEACLYDPPTPPAPRPSRARL